MTPSPSTTFSAARLDAAASQRTFRALLDALARPGQVHRLPATVAQGIPRALLPVLALADVDVTVAILDDDPPVDWHDVVRTATGASRAPLPRADMVVALRAPKPIEVAALETGTPEAPERGARLVIACRALAAAADDVTQAAGQPAAAPAGPHTHVEVRGPGVPGSCRFMAAGVGADVLATVGTRGAYPAGIDVWLVADDGGLVGLPRSVTLAAEAVA